MIRKLLKKKQPKPDIATGQDANTGVQEGMTLDEGPETTDGKLTRAELAWSPFLAKETHYTPVVNAFLSHYAHLTPRLTTAEAMLVIHLMRYTNFKKRGKSSKSSESLPYPSLSRLAREMGKDSTRTIQNLLKSLVKKGCLRVLRRYQRDELGKRKQTTNAYDLRPLVAKLEDAVRQDQAKAGDSPEVIFEPNEW